ncbi:hypothetical protein BBJ28_00018579 [Nothophytophthora sp. Chile5]|nr:hypothetical protein BBJ28_00018579 [Nothophytophthora sp. Chile5]
MGKTPSPDSFLRASAGLRYRRKVPLASDNQHEAVAPLASTQPKSTPPKKKLKPERPVDAQPKHAAVREPERLGGQRSSSNGRRPASGGGKSLLKQLLWKAKPVQPQRAEAAAKEERPTPEEDEEDEEAVFAAAQRQVRKLQASQTAAAKEAPFGGESSSQETQSGSEDETFLPFSSLAPSGDAEPLHCFPSPFPQDLLASGQQQLRVHEVLVADFAFQPAELRIQRGDVVVWRVSPATLGMVEHCLEASFTAASGTAGESAGSPPLGAGSRFAWRFATAGRAAVACSVYNAQSVIIVADEEADAVEEAETGNAGTPGTEEAQPVQQQQEEQEKERQERADARRKQKQQRQKQKQKLKNKQKRAAARQQQQLLQRPENEAEDQPAPPAEDARPEDEMAPVVVFHPPCSLTSEMDAEVCRAVLSQLEEVAPYIVVGDVACPVVGDGDVDGDAEDLTVAREEEVAVEQTGASAEEAVAGFQQHVIAMLQRSEEVQKQRRESFVVDRSGFDAAASYDFFKRRTCGWSCCVSDGLDRWTND